MSRKKTYKILFVLYQAVRNFRYLVLQSVFGVTVHCKHSPTCGTYLFQQIKKQGIVKGSIKGIKRVLTCW